MELSLTAGPRFIMLFIMLELACMRTFCWATSCTNTSCNRPVSDGGTDQALEEELVDLRGEGLLEHREEGVGLAAHCHGQGEVLHAWGTGASDRQSKGHFLKGSHLTVLNIPGGEQLLTHLHLLQEERQ